MVRLNVDTTLAPVVVTPFVPKTGFAPAGNPGDTPNVIVQGFALPPTVNVAFP